MSGARDAITRLVHSYAERIDRGDFEGVAELLAHAALTVEGSEEVRRGRSEILRRYAETTRRYEDCGTPRTQHVTTNLIVDVDEGAGTATCRSYFTVLQQTPELSLQPIIAGRYHDAFERVEGEWRFSRRHIICDLFGDLSQHLLFDASALGGSRSPRS
jgi:ketosteroid isomerase-like protein